MLRSSIRISSGGDYLVLEVRILVVDDFEPFQKLICSLLQERPNWRVVGVVSSVMQAIRLARQLQPDVILLSMALHPKDGVDAVRQIRMIATRPKIVVLGQEPSSVKVREILKLGASAYVKKNYLSQELIAAVEAAVEGRRFIGGGVTGDVTNVVEFSDTDRLSRKTGFPPLSVGQQRIEIAHDHALLFYSDETIRLARVTHFIETAIHCGHSAIVCASQLFCRDLRRTLQAHGLDSSDLAERRRYTSLDAAETASAFTVKDTPDRNRFVDFWNGLLAGKAAATEGTPRVALYCEVASLFWAGGKEEAAVEVEQLLSELVKRADLDVLCGYSLGYVHGEDDAEAIQQICATHSSVRSE